MDVLSFSLVCEDSKVEELSIIQSYWMGCVRIESTKSTREIMLQYDRFSSFMGMCSADSSVSSTEETEDLEFPS